MADSFLSVRDLKALPNGNGKSFQGVYLLRRLATRTASNGNPFLSIELGDRGGTFTSTVFNDSPAFEVLRTTEEGLVVRIDGRIDHYQGRLSPKIQKVEVLDEEDLAEPGLLDTLVESSPLDPDALWKELEGFVASIANPELRQTVELVFEEIGETFRFAPAAIAMHHAYRHGLLEHSVRMARACRALLPLYPEVDADLAMAGVLLHDIGKTIEYEGTLATRRSRRGLTHGHVVLGYQIARKAGLRAKLDTDRLERLEHIILSHQGEPEWGAAVYAATPEAVFVAKVDDLDAKMGMVQRALRQGIGDDEFSERLPGLNTSLLLKPVAEGQASAGNPDQPQIKSP
jgi:3'-5' exoribonuclease